jgi:hypothetical protein
MMGLLLRVFKMQMVLSVLLQLTEMVVLGKLKTNCTDLATLETVLISLSGKMKTETLWVQI